MTIIIAAWSTPVYSYCVTYFADEECRDDGTDFGYVNSYVVHLRFILVDQLENSHLILDKGVAGDCTEIGVNTGSWIFFADGTERSH